MIIHQALHGYKQGHNKLACSTYLSLNDDDSMKVLSDWSEYTDDFDNSYITTYPLKDSKYYVVAKSWYADDMERPGCVWTHSLLINIDDIDEHFDFRDLFDYFRRPIVNNYEQYSLPIEYVKNAHENVNIIENKEELLLMYMLLLKKANNTIFVKEKDSSYYQHLILLILQYVPLGFFPNIYTCSGSAYGRRGYNNHFSLQFSTSTGSQINTVIKDNNAFIDNICPGIKYICDSICKNDLDTASTLRIFSGDIHDNFDSLCTVGLLLKYLDEGLVFGQSSVTFNEVLSLISSTFPKLEDGEIVKKIFCNKNVSNLFDKEITILIYLAVNDYSSMLDYDVIDYDNRVVALKTDGDILLYGKFLEAILEKDDITTIAKRQLERSNLVLSENDYLFMAQNMWRTYMSLVSIMPSILKYSFWIDFTEEKFFVIYQEFANSQVPSFTAWEKLWHVILYRGYSVDKRIMNELVKNISRFIYDVMDYLEKSSSYKLDNSICYYCRSNPKDIVNWLSTKDVVSEYVVQFVVNNIDPESSLVKNSSSNDFRSIIYQSKYNKENYYVFIYLLGLNWDDRIALDCLRKGFIAINNQLANSQMSDDLWKKIEPYTDKLVFYKEWDKCKKLKKGLIRVLKEKGFSKSVLTNFTQDVDLNIDLQNCW